MQLHRDMCKELSAVYCKVLSIFPSLEEARPRSKSGIQALCSLHIALEKAKNILQHCSESSKLYLAITGDAVLLKFEKAKSALIDSLRRVEDIVPSSIGSQILEVVGELEHTKFLLDPSEKEVGDRIIALLQQGKKFDNATDNSELEIFHQAATRLSITSSRSALAERRALKKLIDRARAEEDKRKESILPPTGNEDRAHHAFGRQLSKFGSINFKKSGQVPTPPEELRCPISLQLILMNGSASRNGLTMDITLAPRLSSSSPHLSLTPNYCVKGLIASWCEQNGISVPAEPPESLDLNYWRLALSDTESANSKSVDSIGLCTLKGVETVPLEETSTIVSEQQQHKEEVNVADVYSEETSEINVLEKYQDILAILEKEEDLAKKCKVVENVRLVLKDDEEARILMGANGFVEAFSRFLGSARMITCSHSQGPATALYLNLSCLEKAKPVIGSSQAVPFFEGKEEMISSQGMINTLATVLDTGDTIEQEQAVACLVILCTGSERCIQMVLQEGVIPSLVSISVNGSPRGRDKSQKLLMIFIQ
ncbi:hypothetical protein HID58_025676 [Brassica napus]|uniref:RING-type E3 ubiquitin transferase n=1 Tax=Brassica napus TaxID=3708 RepID=A0ABQ8CLX0_BRANA|nr:hypothetical protein HID58_025676 [Brassica napus]